MGAGNEERTKRIPERLPTEGKPPGSRAAGYAYGWNDCIEEMKGGNMAKDGWIPCSQGKPEEHESFFKKLKGTDRWRTGMHETVSDYVDITILYPDGTRRTDIGKTYDGEWRTSLGLVEKGTVIAWRQRPEPYQGEP